MKRSRALKDLGIRADNPNAITIESAYKAQVARLKQNFQTRSAELDAKGTSKDALKKKANNVLEELRVARQVLMNQAVPSKISAPLSRRDPFLDLSPSTIPSSRADRTEPLRKVVKDDSNVMSGPVEKPSPEVEGRFAGISRFFKALSEKKEGRLGLFIRPKALFLGAGVLVLLTSGGLFFTSEGSLGPLLGLWESIHLMILGEQEPVKSTAPRLQGDAKGPGEPFQDSRQAMAPESRESAALQTKPVSNAELKKKEAKKKTKVERKEQDRKAQARKTKSAGKAEPKKQKAAKKKEAERKKPARKEQAPQNNAALQAEFNRREAARKLEAKRKEQARKAQVRQAEAARQAKLKKQETAKKTGAKREEAGRKAQALRLEAARQAELKKQETAKKIEAERKKQAWQEKSLRIEAARQAEQKKKEETRIAEAGRKAEVPLIKDKKVGRYGYFDNGDGTITNTKTGLMWTREDSYSELGKCMDWTASKKYVGNLRTGGHMDWRLPTMKELKTLYNRRLVNKAFRGQTIRISPKFAQGGSWFAWSSEEAGPCCANFIYLGDGVVLKNDRSYCHFIGVRAVRPVQ